MSDFIFIQTNPRAPTVDKPLNVELKWPETFNYRMSYLHHVVAFSSDSCLALDYSPGTTPFSVKRTLTGSSQAFGRLSVVITNHRTEAINVLYLETMPWLLQFYLHTLEARIDGVVERMSTFSVKVAGAL
jgi:phosphatidylinositol glycan class T